MFIAESDGERILKSFNICQSYGQLFTGLFFETSCITGCAVAQHCYNGDVSFLWENWKFDPPSKIETLEQIVTHFVRIDYVHEMNVCSEFRTNPFRGDFGAKGWNRSLCVTFLFIFSLNNLENRPLDGMWRAIASNDAESCKDVPFWGYKKKIWNLNPI